MSEYIEFCLLDEKGVERNVKMNADDPNEVYSWRVNGCKGLLKNPYWYKFRISKDAYGYKIIRIGSKHYKLHRVCFYAHNPEWDIYDSSLDNSIDHKDRNPANNHISNLRVLTNSQNLENNRSKGYYWCKSSNKWIARIAKDGNAYKKHCKTEEEAIEARRQLKEKYHTY